MRPRRPLMPLVAATGLAISLAACSPAGLAERLTEEGTGVKADGDGSATISEDGTSISSDPDGTVVVESEDGTIEMTQGADLPEGFPSAQVPLIDAPIASASRLTNDKGVIYQVTMTTQDGAAAFTAALDRLKTAGYTVTAESMTESADAVFGSAELNGPYQVLILVMGDTSETMVSYTVNPPVSG